MPQHVRTTIAGIRGWLTLSSLLAVTTVLASLIVARLATGSTFGTVSMPVLHDYGGIRFDDLRAFEIWRLASAQMVHAKQMHMLLNALTFFILGTLVERRTGPLFILLVWLAAGGVATAVSPLFIEPPFDVGTGASQANFALAGAAIILALAGRISGWSIWAAIALALLPGLALDFWHAGYPKLGHTTGLLLGMAAGVLRIAAGIKGRAT